MILYIISHLDFTTGQRPFPNPSMKLLQLFTTMSYQKTPSIFSLVFSYFVYYLLDTNQPTFSSIYYSFCSIFCSPPFLLFSNFCFLNLFVPWSVDKFLSKLHLFPFLYANHFKCRLRTLIGYDSIHIIIL